MLLQRNHDLISPASHLTTAISSVTSITSGIDVCDTLRQDPIIRAGALESTWAWVALRALW